jgi:two-component system nitrogen regulation response regulator GlnG
MQPSQSPIQLRSPRAVAPTAEQLLLAFDGSNWNREGAARLLGISRGCFWRRVTKWPELHRLARVSLPILLYEKEACGGDLERLADVFGTTVPLLSRRLEQGPADASARSRPRRLR